MRILHTSDWHVGKTLRGRSRLAEHEAVLGEIVTISDRERADLVLVAGDLFDSAAPPPDAERLVYRTLLALAGTGAKVLVLAGNHDNALRIQAVEPLLGLAQVVARPLPADEVIQVETRDGTGVQVAMLPWVSKHSIVRAEQVMSLDPDQAHGMYAERIARVVEHLCSRMSPDAVNVLCAHLSIVGAEPGEDVRQAALFEYAVPATIFPAHLHYVALGHYHRPQSVASPVPARYCGSPMFLGFPRTDEEGHAKSVTIVDAVPGRPAEVRSTELTAGRRLRTIRGNLDELEALRGRFGDDWLRVYVREQARAGIAAQVREWFGEAVDVVVDPGDAPAVGEGSARTGRAPGELFREFLAERNEADERLTQLFDRLLEDTHAADPA